jgi:hypothetical protein
MAHDPYWAIVERQWPFIATLYQQYAEKKPVMLYDVEEQRVYAYPFTAYRAELSARSQASLTRQYERATAAGKVVVFVRDNQRKKLVSYSVPLKVGSSSSRTPS